VPVFDAYTTASIGDIAIHPTNPNIVYVGPAKRTTGRRRHSRRHYKTTDGGKTFTHSPSRDADDRAHRHRSPES